MRIRILPVLEFMQPARQCLDWPPDFDQYGIEQDFLYWLAPQAVEGDADWDYLPVFWNRWYLNATERHGGGAFNAELQAVIERPERTFTVSELDPFGLMPGANLDGVTVFTANRMGAQGIDVPLLTGEHRLHQDVERHWLASFTGNMETHKCREEMRRALSRRDDCLVTGEGVDISEYTRRLQASYIGLAPRGDGGQSFRFYEAMQASTVPMLIGVPDTRPFKAHIDWDGCSLYRSNCIGLAEYLDSLDKDELVAMGRQAHEVWRSCLYYGQWERYVIEELEKRS